MKKILSKKISLLEKKAKKLRQKTFLAFIKKGEAHLGGSFSMIEPLIFLYDYVLNKNDKFILSKSHSSFPLCILLQEKGYNNKIKTHLEIDEKNLDLFIKPFFAVKHNKVFSIWSHNHRFTV